jgi:hypothetical protein
LIALRLSQGVLCGFWQRFSSTNSSIKLKLRLDSNRAVEQNPPALGKGWPIGPPQSKEQWETVYGIRG